MLGCNCSFDHIFMVQANFIQTHNYQKNHIVFILVVFHVLLSVLLCNHIEMFEEVISAVIDIFENLSVILIVLFSLAIF